MLTPQYPNIPIIIPFFLKQLWLKIEYTKYKLQNDSMLREKSGPIPSPSVNPDWSKPITPPFSPVIDLYMAMGNENQEGIFWESSGKVLLYS